MWNTNGTKKKRAVNFERHGVHFAAVESFRWGKAAAIEDRRRSYADKEDRQTRRGIAADPDNPTWPDEEIARARPAVEVLPKETYEAALKRRRGLRGPQEIPTKKLVTLRLERDQVPRSGFVEFRAAIAPAGPG